MFKNTQDILEIIILVSFVMTLVSAAVSASIYMNDTLEQQCALKKGVFSKSIDYRYSECQLPKDVVDKN